MARSVLLVILSIYVVGYNSLPFYDYPRPYNGFGDLPRLFRDMFFGRRHRPEFHREEMPPFDPQFSGMTPVLIPLNNLGYPEPGPQFNVNNQVPDQSRISSLFKRAGALPSQDSIVEDPSEPLPLHLSTSSALPKVETTTTPTSADVRPPNNEETTNPSENNVPEKKEKLPNSEQGDPKTNTDPKLEKQSIENQDPNRIVFPDTIDNEKHDLSNKNGNPSEPNRFTDAPEILYAVNIGPSLTTQYDAQAISAPLTNAISRQPQNTQTVPYTNNPGYKNNNQNGYNNPNVQYTGQPTYVTYQNPNPTYTNVVSRIPNTIALPNSNGGTTFYTVLNVPLTSGSTYYPTQTYQPSQSYQPGQSYQPSQTYLPSNVVSNPGNYQILPNGYQSSPSYYMVPPNQNSQSYPSYPQTYKVGYVSSNGQTVLVPSNSQIIQLGPQANYVPLVNGQSAGTQTSPSVYLPDNTNTVSLISFKEKGDEKLKESAEKKEESKIEKLRDD